MVLTGQFYLGDTALPCEQKREQILTAAQDLFLARRYDLVTLDAVCAEAGVGKGTIYRYFEDKEDLFAQMLLNGLDELQTELEARAGAQNTVQEQLLAVAKTLAEFYRTRRALLHSAFTADGRRWAGHGLKEKMRAHGGAMTALVAGIVAEGAKTGQCREVDAEASATLFLGMTRAGLRSRKGHGRAIASETIVDVFLNGIREHD